MNDCSSLSSDVTGAYWAVQESSFIWSDSRWVAALSGPPPLPKNLWVSATDGAQQIAYVGDSLYLPPAAMNDAAGHPNSVKNVVVLEESDRTSLLGRGVATAVRAARVVGYDSNFSPLSETQGLDFPVNAWEWTPQHALRLGAGIACSVNVNGDVVGDDRKTLRSAGYPTLWKNGRNIRLASMRGSAFAVADDGTIVGDVGSRAFVVRSDDPAYRPVLIDSLLEDHRWHIKAAYAIASDGTILALASRGGSDQLVVLHPVK